MATEAAPAPPVDSEPVLESAGGRRFRIAEYAGFAPALILYGAFFAVPLGIIVAYSFWKVVDYNVVHDWTTDNYRYFFSVATYVRTLWATIWVSVLSTVLTIAVAFPFAYWLVRYVPRRMQRTLLVLVIYLAANVAYLAVMPIEEMRHSKLVAADVAQRVIGSGGAAFVSVTVMLSTFGTLNTVLLTSPRV